jgi:cytochrome c oxidase cbb3-type subunit 3
MIRGFIHHTKVKGTLAFCLLFFSCFNTFAQAQTAPAGGMPWGNTSFTSLFTIIVMLFVVILFFMQVMLTAIKYRTGIIKEEQEKSGNTIKTVIAVLAFTAICGSLNAQGNSSTPAAPRIIQGLDANLFYTMVGFIFLELFVIVMMGLYTMRLLRISLWSKKPAVAAQKSPKKKRKSVVDAINASVSIEKEADILLDHNYDGIQELDNNLPPWWKYGFYLTIIVAVVYMVHFHITKTGKLQGEEYQEQIAIAKQQYEEYKKNAADLVDETSVTLLTDNTALSAGKAIFMTNCAPCHGKAGEGVVGPNLTDEYWLHDGGVKDIFKTIKFGWPEKGMKSWQQDLSPKQIQEVASYIKSLKGTNPPNGKEKQGELYKD